MRSNFLRYRDKAKLVRMTYWLGFLGALHGFLLIYVNAPFLATFTSEKWVGVIYTIASIIAVIAFVFTSLS